MSSFPSFVSSLFARNRGIVRDLSQDRQAPDSCSSLSLRAPFSLVFSCFLTLLGLPAGVHAQWGPDERLTFYPSDKSAAYSTSWTIAATGDTVHNVWTDDRTGNGDIYYKRSINGGVSWEADTRVSYDNELSILPALGVSGSPVVHLAWFSEDDLPDTGSDRILYTRSTDGGTTWESPTHLATTFTPFSIKPTLAVSGSTVHVAWKNYPDSSSSVLHIYTRRSTDAGATWAPFVQLTADSTGRGSPSIAASGDTVWVAWATGGGVGTARLGLALSTNGGATWTPEATAGDLRYSISGWNVSIRISGSVFHAIWSDYDQVARTYRVFYRRSTDGGTSWEAGTYLGNSNQLAGGGLPLNLSASGPLVHVVWEDRRFGLVRPEIYYSRSTDSGVSWEAETRLTNDYSSSEPSVAVSGPAVHVTWIDTRDHDGGEVYYKRDSTGNASGIGEEAGGPSFRNAAALLQSHPNPLKPSTTIGYRVQERSRVTIRIYDVRGRLVKSLVDGDREAGEYSARWSGRDVFGREVPNGTYLCTMATGGDLRATRKLVVVR